MATLTLSAASAPPRADAVVVAIASGPDGPVLLPGTEEVDRGLDGRLVEALAALGANGAAEQVTKVATLGALPVPVIAAVGLGPRTPTYSADTVRRAAGAASRALAGRATVISTLALVNGAEADPALVTAAGEGALLGGYEFTRYKSTPGAPLPAAFSLAVTDPSDPRYRAAVSRAAAVSTAVRLARDLTNTPPNDLVPASLAERAEQAAHLAGLEVEVLDEKALKKGGYGGVLAVGMGSVHPPRLVRLHYRGPGTGTGPGVRVALVGKGITFDSGGLSIKPASGMEIMKSDMAGAAAVIATMTLAAALRLPLEITATVPMAENLPGGSAYRPQDVLTMYGGQRVEVLNTDAEGRLILADGIVRACEDTPTYLLEVSTLTGSQLIALGTRTTGVMGSDGLRDRVVRAGDLAGEGMWPMPLPDELRTDLDSTVADMANITGHRNGGMLAAGQFLASFVADGVQWAHLDIAGPAYNTRDPWGCTPRGGTGVPVRTLLATLEDIAGNG